MRILLINNYLYPRGGAERSFLRVGELLQAKGHQVIHFACGHPQNLASSYERFFPPYRDFHKLTGPLARLSALTDMIYNRTAAKNLSRLLRQVRPDIAHLNNIYHHLSPSILPVLARQNIPTVLHLRDGKLACPAIYMFRSSGFCDLCRRHRFWPVLLYRCGYNSLAHSTALAIESAAQDLLGFYRRYVDLYICPSRFLRRQIIARGYQASKIVTLPNFVLSLSSASSDQTSVENLPLRYLFCASRLTVEKGLLVLIEAARLTPQIPLLIAGQGPARNQMLALIQRHHLSNVQLLGWQNEKQLAQLFHNATASIAPSLLPENCPNVVLESSAQACPVIAGDVGGTSELISDGHDGWLVCPGRADQLAQAMTRAYAHPQLSARLGAAARQRIIRDHHPDLFYRKLMEIYRRVRETHP